MELWFQHIQDQASIRLLKVSAGGTFSILVRIFVDAGQLLSGPYSLSMSVNKYWVSQGETNAGFWAHEVYINTLPLCTPDYLTLPSSSRSMQHVLLPLMLRATGPATSSIKRS